MNIFCQLTMTGCSFDWRDSLQRLAVSQIIDCGHSEFVAVTLKIKIIIFSYGKASLVSPSE